MQTLGCADLGKDKTQDTTVRLGQRTQLGSCMEFSWILTSGSARGVAVDGTNRIALPLLDQQKATQTVVYRSKLEEVEAAIEAQRNSIRSHTHAEPIIGLRPPGGHVAGGGAAGTANVQPLGHAGMESGEDDDGDDDADVLDDAATATFEDDDSGSGDEMAIVGELHDDDDEEEDGSDVFDLDDVEDDD